MKNHPLLFVLTLFFASCYQKANKAREMQQTPNKNYDQAWAYRDQDRLDSAYLFFNKAKDEFNSIKDSIGTAKCLINMAEIAYLNGDYFGSQELATTVDNYLDTTKQVERELLSSNYNTLGNVSNGLKRYEEANVFFKKASIFTKNQISLNLYDNNIGVNLMYLKKYNDAIFYLSKAIKDTNAPNYAMSLSNIGKVKWLQNQNFNPVPIFKKALAIRIKENKTLGQSASYSHLADYYTKENKDSALYYAEAMFLTAKKANSADNKIEALEKLVELGDEKSSKVYFTILKKLNDSIQTARNSAKNQFALIRYETEKHKANNLILQKQNTEKNYQIGIIATFSISLSIGAIVWYRKRKQRNAIEATNTIRENQLKTSKKVHDVVANGLYRIMSKLDHQEAFKNNPIIDEMELLYEKSRNISYEEVKYNSHNFAEKISTLLKSFASNQTKILIVGNDNELWNRLNDLKKYEIEHILQELMVNMKKHSEAKSVIVKFEAQLNIIIINYSDDGIGTVSKLKYGNGLNNTGNRIKNINGTLTFENNVDSGLKISLVIPLI